MVHTGERGGLPADPGRALAVVDEGLHDLAEGIPWAEMRELVQSCDLVLDQFTTGSYGTFAVEAMAAGKPVVAYISDSVKAATDGALPIVVMSPEWEQAFAESLVGVGDEKQLALAPSRLQEFIRSVREVFERTALAGDTPVLLTSPGVRPYVRSIIERFRGQTVVMSQNEIHPKARLKTVGQV